MPSSRWTSDVIDSWIFPFMSNDIHYDSFMSLLACSKKNSFTSSNLGQLLLLPPQNITMYV